MYDFTTDETRTYALAKIPPSETEVFPQLTTADTGWADDERKVMNQHGYDGMDMLRTWLD